MPDPTRDLEATDDPAGHGAIAPAAGAPPRPWFGYALCVLTAVSFAMNSTLAGLAFSGGSDAISLLAFRSAVAVLALLAFLRLRRAPAPPPEIRRRAWALGVMLAAYSYGLIGAMEYIPVGMAVLIFYTYPLIIAVLSWARGRERPSVPTIAALLVAFFGLLLVLNVTAGDLDGTGVAMAAGAAVTLATLVVFGERTLRRGGAGPVTLHMMAAATLVYAAVDLALGHFALPTTTAAWIGFLGAPLFYAFPAITFFYVIGLLGPVRTGLVMNLEPIASLSFAFLILGQRLALIQLLGCALVIGALTLVRLRSPAAAAVGTPD